MNYEEIIERNNKIVKLWENGYTYLEISKMFNVSKQRIFQIIKKYPNIEKGGLQKKIDMKLDINKIKELRLKGYSWKTIVKELKTSYEILKNRINRNDFPKYGDNNKWYCKRCKIIDNINNFYIKENNNHIHKPCQNKYITDYNRAHYKKHYKGRSATYERIN
jgi:transposase